MKPSTLPLVFEPPIPGENLLEHVRTRRTAIDEALLQHGAILFRGFFGQEAPGPDVFERIAEALCDALLDKNPEHVNVTGKVQTSRISRGLVISAMARRSPRTMCAIFSTSMPNWMSLSRGVVGTFFWSTT